MDQEWVTVINGGLFLISVVAAFVICGAIGVSIGRRFAKIASESTDTFCMVSFGIGGAFFTAWLFHLTFRVYRFDLL
jgi:hypothetical protein